MEPRQKIILRASLLIHQVANAPLNPVVMTRLSRMGPANERIDNAVTAIGKARAQSNFIVGIKAILEHEFVIDEVHKFGSP